MKRNGIIVTLVVGMVAWGTAAGAADWTEYSNSKLGLRMLVPGSVKVIEVTVPDGWSGVQISGTPVLIRALVKNSILTVQNLLNEAAGLVSIPVSAWEKTDGGKDSGGWQWFATYQASDGKNIVFSVQGQGAKGSYIVYLLTTVADFSNNRDAYLRWFGSLELLR